jgi:hypothetical protein
LPVAGCRLLVVGCWLLVASCRLPANSYQLAVRLAPVQATGNW